MLIYMVTKKSESDRFNGGMDDEKRRWQRDYKASTGSPDQYLHFIVVRVVIQSGSDHFARDEKLKL